MNIPRLFQRNLSIALLVFPIALFGQIQHNGTVPIAPQPSGMPPADPNAPFAVTAVTYAALPPNDHYSAKFTTTAAGKAFGFLDMGVSIIFDAATRTLDFSNQFALQGSAVGLQVMATDGPDQSGIYNDGTHGTRCFVQTPAGFSQDLRFVAPGPFIATNVFAADYSSQCTGVDHGVQVGTAFNEIFTETVVHEGILSQLTGYSQTPFAGNLTLGDPAFGGAFLKGCCSRGRAIRGNQVVGDSGVGGALPLPPDPLGFDSSPAGNTNSNATLWLLSDPSHAIQLAPAPSVALATNGVQQGGWANAHAVIWSGTSASMVDLNPPGYFDSRVTGMTSEFQAGDGWLGGPANSPGAVQHALLWRGSAASVIDLNQYLPSDILGASISGVDPQGNIVGSMTISTGRSFGIYFQPTPAQSVVSLSIAPANLAPGATASVTVALGAPGGPGGVALSFTSDTPSLLAPPAPVTIPEGQSSLTFQTPVADVFLAAPAAVTLTAHAGFTAASGTLGVSTGAPADALTSLTLSTSQAAPGDIVTIQVGLVAPAPAGGVAVTFASSNPAVAPAPIALTVPEGATSATTPLVLAPTAIFNPVVLALEAQTGNVTLSTSLTVASPSTLSTIFLGSLVNGVSMVAGNSLGTGFVGFSARASAGGTVTLATDNPALVVPASTTFVAGSANATFNYTALPVPVVTNGTVSASSNGVTVSTTVSISPSPAPTLKLLTIPVVSPASTFSSGETITGTVTLTAPAFAGGMTLAIATDVGGVVQVPASVTVPGGTISATFPVTALAVAAPAKVTVTATLPGNPGLSVSLTVIPGPALSINSFTLSPFSTIGPGVVTNGTITINQPAPAGGVTLAVSASKSGAKVPASVTIATGANSATIAVQGNGVNTPTAILLTASYSGVLAPLGTSAAAPLHVAPTDVLKAPKPTWSSSTHLLEASCTSTNPQAIITVLNASGNIPIGTMNSLGDGTYTFQATIASIASINFKSNLGGSTGQGVTVIP